MKKLTSLAIGAVSIAAMACSTSTQQRPEVASQAGCSELNTAQATQQFYAPGQVYSAKQVQERQFIARAIQPRRTMGAELYMRAQPGLTGEYLERALSCHAASGQAAHPNDPVHPTSGAITELKVRSAPSGFAVRIVGENPAVGKEIWQRSRAFTSPSSSVDVQQVGAAKKPTLTL